MVLKKENKKTIISGYKEHEKDTGSAPVQIALLTERINQLTDHFKAHRADHHSRTGLLRLVSQRRKLLDYLKRADTVRYQQIVDKLSLRK
jgi:small subunit ribosomal protein S15